MEINTKIEIEINTEKIPLCHTIFENCFDNKTYRKNKSVFKLLLSTNFVVQPLINDLVE